MGTKLNLADLMPRLTIGSNAPYLGNGELVVGADRSSARLIP